MNGKKLAGLLKPCPFCGGKKFYITPEDIYESEYKDSGIMTIRLECEDCCVIIYDHINDEIKDYAGKVDRLITRWNRRISDGT